MKNQEKNLKDLDYKKLHRLAEEIKKYTEKETKEWLEEKNEEINRKTIIGNDKE
jgi:hypothetical protein